MNVSWHGIYADVITHFKPNQTLDVPATLSHIDKMLEDGVHGIILLGAAGENCSLSRHEKSELLRSAVQHIDGRVPILAGLNEGSAALASAFSEDAQRVGVDGLVLSIAPNYKPDIEEALAYIRMVANSSKLPIMFNNDSKSCGIDITPSMFTDLADLPQLVALNETTESVRRFVDLKTAVEDRFMIFCGADQIIMESFSMGAVGWISPMVNAYAKENCFLWTLLSNRKYEKALSFYRWYGPLTQLMNKPKLVQRIKLAVQEHGYGSELARAPRLPLGGDEREEVLSLIHSSMAIIA